MPFRCPVCAYPKLPYPAADYEICPSCGTEFEYHDARRTHAELREQWKASGAKWYSAVVAPPTGWNGYKQLLDGDLAVPRFADYRLEGNLETSPFGRIIWSNQVAELRAA